MFMAGDHPCARWFLPDGEEIRVIWKHCRFEVWMYSAAKGYTRELGVAESENLVRPIFQRAIEAAAAEPTRAADEAPD